MNNDKHKSSLVKSIVLNDQQEMARDNFINWYRNAICQNVDRMWFEISGPAGSGKTTIVRQIIDYLGLKNNEVVFVTYTGKAALALRLSGVPGRTIHSFIYQPTHVYERDELGRIIYSNGTPVSKIKFVKIEKVPESVKLIVVDEGGMVETSIGNDLLSYNIPILVLGDLHQLPPVFGNGIFLHKPDSILTKVMRQNEGSPIIYLSQLAIHHQLFPYGEYGGGKAEVIHKEDFLTHHEIAQYYLSKADMVICATNKMRDMLNRYIRTHLQHITSSTISLGDKLICRQNCWDIILPKPYEDIALVNGLIGTVKGIYRESKKSGPSIDIDFLPEFTDHTMFENLSIDHKYLFSDYENRKTINPMMTDKILFEFGNAITCHLSQGSQSNSVLLFVENVGDSDYFFQWLYTGVTRAINRLVVVQ